MARIYCKVYKFNDVCTYPAFNIHANVGTSELCYIWDDFTVTSSPVPDSSDNLVFDAVSREWQTFCAEQLQFSVPSEIIAMSEQLEPTS